MKGCSQLCNPGTDDPACRNCRLAPVENFASRDDKLYRVLSDLDHGLKFYLGCLEQSRGLPWSWQIEESLDDLFEEIDKVTSWTRRHLEEVEKRLR